jgi:hypothetical protein
MVSGKIFSSKPSLFKSMSTSHTAEPVCNSSTTTAKKSYQSIILITDWVINNQSSSHFAENTGEKTLKTIFMKNPT